MLLSQLLNWGGICLLICALIFFLIRWRKMGFLLIGLIIAITFIYSFGIAKYSIFGSMRLDSIPTVMDLEVGSESVSPGKAILNSLQSWNKMLRGKKPIYTTSGGAQISVDSIGDEKSIKLFKPF